MGAYYMWIDATKGECLGDAPFAYGLKVIENCRWPNDRTDALLTLLAGRWAGDVVVYASDYDDLSLMELGGGMPMFGRRRQARVPRCPRCGSTDVERTGEHLEPMPGQTFPRLGSTDMVPVSEWRCNTCGHTWDEPFGWPVGS